jgi:N-acyl-D-amino-acid deacylase
MTSLPAKTLSLKRKGLIKAGSDADIVIFDPNQIRDRATFKEPLTAPKGVEFVVVDGRLAVEKGLNTDERAGRVQRRPS